MTVLEAYARRAEEYAALLGSVEAMDPADVRRIETWALTVDGPLLDLGCGPGHWTGHLAALALDVEGWDPVAEFVRIATARHRGTRFRRAALADLEERPAAWGGILAWYSLIHLEPAEMPGALAALHRALRPGGTLLLGFFDGTRQEPFDHAVARAHHWPAALMAELLEEAGFEVVDVEARHDTGARPHAAVHAAVPSLG